MAGIVTLRRRRGVVKASITKLTTRLGELECMTHEPMTSSRAQVMLKKLETLDADFKTHHFAIVNAADTDEVAEKEQDELDRHDDEVAALQVRLEALVAPNIMGVTDSSAISPPAIDGHVLADCRLFQLESRLAVVNTAISKLTSEPQDLHLLDLYQEQLRELKRELSEIRNSVITLIGDEASTLETKVQQRDREIFDLSVTVKRLLYNPTTATTLAPYSSVPESHGVKLPKIDVPAFNGELLHWQSFWDQFCIAIHDRKDISPTEKLIYLRQSLKDGSAKSIIEGLSISGDQYPEAIASLQARYDRPRLLHQTHVRRIYDLPNLKEGSGKELRRFHDIAQQHLCALKAMGKEPSSPFITSLLELKLDQGTLFEWQKSSQDAKEVPQYTRLLEFLNLRAQVSESCSQDKKPLRSEIKKQSPGATTFVSTVSSLDTFLKIAKATVVARSANDPTTPSFIPKSRNLGIHKPRQTPPTEEQASMVIDVSSNTQSGTGCNTLLMTCQVLIHAPDGSSMRARGLLDSGSSASFVSERLAQSLRLRRSTRNILISGVAEISHHFPMHSVATFEVSSVSDPTDKLEVSAIVVPRVTRELPVQPVHLKSSWSHLSGLYLADPNFGQPGKIDVLLGVDIFASVILQGRRSGPMGSPIALETKFGWVLAGKTSLTSDNQTAVTHHLTVCSSEDILHKFWELEESPTMVPNLSPEERTVVRHFEDSHTRTKDGRFVVPLPKNTHAKPIGESRPQAVRRFLSLEQSLHAKNQFSEFSAVMEEYMQMNHAELVPVADLQKPSQEVFYLPMHAVKKEHSTTTKIRAVFDASAKSSTGVSLNDTLLVGPTVHSSLIDVLLRFRLHHIALTADVSKMYRAVELAVSDRDLHRFVWRNSPDLPLRDYRMTRVTFGISASPFAANMALKQNALDYALDYPLAAEVMQTSFYVDDGLTGANSVEEAVELQRQLQTLFSKGGFLLRKWNSSDPQVLQSLAPELKDLQPEQVLPSGEQYTKTLGIAWNASKDHFKLSVCDPPPLENITKRALVSDIADVRCAWMVVTINHQGKDLVAATLGTEGGLGQACPSSDSR